MIDARVNPLRIKDSSTIKFLVFPELDNLELVRGKNIMNSFPLHIHKTFNIGLIEKGSACLTTLSDSFTINEAQIFIINPGEPHSIRPATDGKSYSYTILCIAAESIQKLYGNSFGNEGNLPQFANILWDNNMVLEGIRMLVSALQNNSAFEEKKGLFSDLLMNLFFSCHSSYREDCNRLNERTQLMNEVRKTIEQRCMENLTLRELSGIANLSSYHFLRTFKLEIGIAPYTYQLQRRIKNAQKMLTPETSISDVAQRTGFNDQSHFTRFFKKVIGITPGQYVKDNKNEG